MRDAATRSISSRAMSRSSAQRKPSSHARGARIGIHSAGYGSVWITRSAAR